MSEQRQGDYLWIDDAASLTEILGRLRDEPRLALDTESNSMHAYFERVCLVQISVPGLDVLIDALAVDIAPLGELLADPGVQKVMHGADYDILCFKRGHGFSLNNLFDTMLAARVLGWPQYGLAAILGERFGRSLDKRFQRYDWGRRPIDAEALRYAVEDTRWLLALRDQQVQELQARDRLDEAEHAFERQTRVEPRELGYDPDDFWKIKGARDLDRKGQAVLKSLYAFRDRIARKLDRPYFRVLGDPVLLHLARVRPKRRDELDRVKGLSRPLRERQGRALLDAIAQGEGAEPPPPRRPSKPKHSKEVVQRYEQLRTWRKEVAAHRGIEPDIVLSKTSLMAIAHSNPRRPGDLERIDELDDWERDRYGDAILKVLGV